jgi:hypothetical protein
MSLLSIKQKVSKKFFNLKANQILTLLFTKQLPAIQLNSPADKDVKNPKLPHTINNEFMATSRF